MSLTEGKKNLNVTTSSRRGLFKSLGAGLAIGAISTNKAHGLGAGSQKRGVLKGRINQSVVSWCFSEYWSVEETCRQAKRLGCKSVELIDSKHWPTLKKYGLTLCNI